MSSFAYLPQNNVEQAVDQEVIIVEYPGNDGAAEAVRPRVEDPESVEYDDFNPPPWTVEDFLDKNTMPKVVFPVMFENLLAGSIVNGKIREDRTEKFKRLLFKFVMRHLRYETKPTPAQELQVRVARNNFFDYYTKRWPNSYVKAKDFRKLVGSAIRQRVRRDRMRTETLVSGLTVPKLQGRKQATPRKRTAGGQEGASTSSLSDYVPHLRKKTNPASLNRLQKLQKERDDAVRRAEAAEAAVTILREQLEWTREMFRQQQTLFLSHGASLTQSQIDSLPSSHSSTEQRTVCIIPDSDQEQEQEPQSDDRPSSSVIIVQSDKNHHQQVGEVVKMTQISRAGTGYFGFPPRSIIVQRNATTP